MKVPPVKHLRPSSLAEATALLREHDGEAKVLAGGQSLIPLLALRMATPSVLVDVAGVAQLRHKWFNSSGLNLSAGVRHREVERDPRIGERFGALADALPLIGHVGIRNRGTVGGSLVHADAAAEWPTLAMLFDATMTIASGESTREVAAEDFFHGFMSTAVEETEVLSGIQLTDPGERSASAFVELARRHGDFALVGVGACLALDERGAIRHARLAACGVATTAHRAVDAEALMLGRQIHELDLDAISAAAAESINPPADLSGSTAYRKRLTDVLTSRAISAAIARLEEERS